MDRDSTFKEHHFWELQRRDALNSSLSLHVGAATLLIGGAYTMSKAVTDQPGLFSHLLSGGLMITGLLLLATMFCLVRAIFGYGYYHAPDMRDLLNDRRHWIAENRRVAGLPKEGLSDDFEAEDRARRKGLNSFYESTDDFYAKSAGQNGVENKRKNYWIYWSNRFITGSLIFFLLSGIPYLAVTLGSPEKPTKVHIVHMEEQT